MSDLVFLACSNCHEMIIKGVGGEIKMRTKILLISEEKGARAVCKGCGEEIPLPVKLDMDMVKSLAQERSPFLYLRTLKERK